MGKNGGAKDGVPRPGCHCRACDVTNTTLNAGNRNAWSAAELAADWNPRHVRHDWEREERAWMDWVTDGAIAQAEGG